MRVSIHTPAWGVTVIYFILQHQSNCFNPHSRVGSDIEEFGAENIQNVSIHTPAWGVTFNYKTQRFGQYVSIHTPAWGVTLLFDVIEIQ